MKGTKLYYALLEHYGDDSEHLMDDIIKVISDDEMYMILRRIAVQLEEKGLIVDEAI